MPEGFTVDTRASQQRLGHGDKSVANTPKEVCNSPGNSRSSSSASDGLPPSFSSKRLEFEKLVITIAHRQIASETLCDSEKITSLINASAKNHGASTDVFAWTADCVEFLRQRPFLFEKHPTDKYYRNTGFAHRKGLVNIVQFLQKNSSVYDAGCPIERLLSLCKNEVEGGIREDERPVFRFEVYDPEKWKVQRWNDSYFFHVNVPIKEAIENLLEEYSLYFEVVKRGGREFVRLKPLTFDIPSLWSEELHPPLPRSEPFSDKSRKHVFFAHVTSVGCYSSTAEIVGGFYYGRRIYLGVEELGFSNVPVFIHGHLVLGGKHDFISTRIVPLEWEGKEQRRERKIRRRSSIDLSEGTVAAFPTLSLLSEKEVTERATLKKFMESEKALIGFVDGIVARGNFTRAEFEKQVAGSDYKPFFAKPENALEFVLERPYLYEFSRDGHLCTAPKLLEYYMLFEFLNDRGKGGMTIDLIEQLLRAGAGGELLKKIVVGRELPELMRSVAAVLTVARFINPVRTKYALKHYFDKTEKILLPGCPNTASHVSVSV